MSADTKPTLWHIPVSHYNEKVRWALEYKGVDHGRKAPPPPSHIAAAMWLTRGGSKTFPVLDLDGRRIGDSTAIIAALERSYPDPPLYPQDAAELERALALEDFFDEEVGPHTRLLAFHELRRDPDALAAFATTMVPGPIASNPTARRLAGKGAGAYAQARFKVGGEDAATLARAKILAGFDRLEAELEKGEGDYLVGNAFSVADVTAASLLAPVVGPPEGPAIPQRPAAFERFTAPLRERAGYRWVEQMFRRHRQNARRP